MFEPVIKWSGSKRSQAEEILKNIPKEISVYYEPFCGGCSVLRRLLYEVEQNENRVDKFVCSDLNSDLIALWNLIKSDYSSISTYYEILWEELNVDDDCERKKAYFESVRCRLNKEHNPKDFMFIMRTTTNGMPRYNKKGDFNNSFHITRNGIIPNKLDKILSEWSKVLNKFDVVFNCCTYEDVLSAENDFMYLDPPYANTKGMYMGAINCDSFFEWLKKQKGGYCFSFDGISGSVNNTVNVPTDVFSEHKYLFSGNSSFKRTIGKSNDSIVYESLYLK